MMLCIAQTMPLQDVCSYILTFVCSVLSITCMYSVKTIIDILKVFSQIATVAFACQTVWQYCNEDLPNEGIECKGGYENNHDFRLISHFISDIILDTAIVTMEGK